jgi:hypothetical protein
LDWQKLIVEQLQAIQEDTKSLQGATSTEELDKSGIGSSLLAYLTSRLDYSERTQEQRNWQKYLITAIYHDSDSEVGEPRGPSISENRHVFLQSVLVESLKYQGMNDRHGRIAGAYEKTFQWVFQDESFDQQSPPRQ